jgi:enoyl-[acyl-carrier protein] reductase II
MAIKTRVTERLGIEAPILSAGMATSADATLAAAVSNAGGLGIIGTVDRELDDIDGQIGKVRQLTERPFGVNCVIAYAEAAHWDVIYQGRPPLVQTSWGDPKQLVKRSHESGSLHAHQVATVEAAKEAVAAGVDFIIAQGSEGGGHVGWVGAMALIPQVLDVAEGIPVIAAGGVVDGRGLAAALAMGAEGVLVGTRFLATSEAPIPDYWKQAIVGARSESILLSHVPDTTWGVDWPGATARVIENQLIRDWNGRLDELKANAETVAARIQEARDTDDAEYTPLYAGQGAGGIAEILPAAEILRRMVADAECAIQNAHRLVGV